MRKQVSITINDEGRDQYKTFIINEMPATKAEKWAIRAFLALAKSGVELPEDVTSAGMAGIAVLGFRALAGLRFEDAELLMDELMTCVLIKVDAMPNGRMIMGSDIEEVKTLFRLKMEVFALHTGFSITDALQKQTSTVSSVQSASSTTQMSQGQSVQ
jgi:hypothetical protein